MNSSPSSESILSGIYALKGAELQVDEKLRRRGGGRHGSAGTVKIDHPFVILRKLIDLLQKAKGVERPVLQPIRMSVTQKQKKAGEPRQWGAGICMMKVADKGVKSDKEKKTIQAAVEVGKTAKLYSLSNYFTHKKAQDHKM